MNCDIKKRTIMIFPQFENINIIDENEDSIIEIEIDLRDE